MQRVDISKIEKEIKKSKINPDIKVQILDLLARRKSGIKMDPWPAGGMGIEHWS